MIAVTAAIISRDNKLLIAKRGEGKHLSGFWEFPGGKIEEGENPKDCLKREINEELGVDIKVGDYFMTNEHSYGEKRISLAAFHCEIISGNIELHDHDEIKWVTISELEQYIFAPADIPFINKLKENA
ncbi:8-oxo-dGTP diphosphatase MutT [Candidatus Gracilibacteria bacterium]|nr:8-oxo-dGTP diphosphatase MutT [Candidatus Gracilibacteria bacterium]